MRVSFDGRRLHSKPSATIANCVGLEFSFLAGAAGGKNQVVVNLGHARSILRDVARAIFGLLRVNKTAQLARAIEHIHLNLRSLYDGIAIELSLYFSGDLFVFGILAGALPLLHDGATSREYHRRQGQCRCYCEISKRFFHISSFLEHT